MDTPSVAGSRLKLIFAKYHIFTTIHIMTLENLYKQESCDRKGKGVVLKLRIICESDAFCECVNE